MREPGSVEARSLMQIGSALAGVAIENSMLGAAHAAANPLTAHFGLVHGIAVGVMLPHVVRMNGLEAEVAAAYARLSPDKAMADQLSDWLQMAGLPSRLRDCGVVDAASLAPLAAEAAAQWTAQFNPVAVETADFARLYQAAW